MVFAPDNQITAGSRTWKNETRSGRIVRVAGNGKVRRPRPSTLCFVTIRRPHTDELQKSTPKNPARASPVFFDCFFRYFSVRKPINSEQQLREPANSY
jgi:hypothetical protein